MKINTVSVGFRTHIFSNSDRDTNHSTRANWGIVLRIFSEIDEPLDFNETLVNGSIINVVSMNNIYASPSSEEAYRDRRLTTNFEFWVEIFCVSTCFHVRIPKPCLSVRPSVCLSIWPYPEKRNHHSFVSVSPTLVIDTSMERFSRLLQHGNPKIGFFLKKVRNSNFDFWRWAEITVASSISVLH